MKLGGRGSRHAQDSLYQAGLGEILAMKEQCQVLQPKRRVGGQH